MGRGDGGGVRLHRSLQQGAGSLNIKRLLLNKEKQVSQIKKFSTFLCMERCKSLDSMKSFLSHASQLSAASIPCFFSVLTTVSGCSPRVARSQVLFSLLVALAAAAAKSLHLCSTLYDPIDSSLPGSPVPGILARSGVLLASLLVALRAQKIRVEIADCDPCLLIWQEYSISQR